MRFSTYGLICIVCLLLLSHCQQAEQVTKVSTDGPEDFCSTYRSEAKKARCYQQLSDWEKLGY